MMKSRVKWREMKKHQRKKSKLTKREKKKRLKEIK